MNISNPTNDVVLPDDVQQALESARNNVTVLETERTRLQGIVGQQHANLDAVLTKIENETEALGRLTSSKEIVKKELEDAIISRDKALSDRDAYTKELNATKETIAIERNEIDAEKNSLLNDRTAFYLEKEKHAAERALFEADKKNHAEKVKRLADAIR